MSIQKRSTRSHPSNLRPVLFPREVMIVDDDDIMMMNDDE